MLLLCISYCPHKGGIKVVHDTVDVQELNHFYDDRGAPALDQVIWWRRKWSYCNLLTNAYKVERRYVYEHRIVDWRLIKNADSYPFRVPGGWMMVFYDGKTNVYRCVRFKILDESWTMFDHELMDRDNLPENKRELLGGPRKSTQAMQDTLP